ncbi:hypothetical protein AcW1_001085 [Taiwanofungus camphoratus]|nr:hypothetical protein AcV5_004999 [Antrodia cinnamomea]KAI0964214.1 hypothetical protein AcW1_001085 [Antrodia cinnamomea]
MSIRNLISIALNLICATALLSIRNQQILSTDCGRSAAPSNFVNCDPAGQLNLATRIEVTSSPNETLYCAQDGDSSIAGYAHFTNSAGLEDKHMFWWLFEARRDPANAPVVLIFGGGPGSSAMFMSFSGAGPCRLVSGNDGNGEAVTAEYSWTRDVNVLAIDHPVGVGFSYGHQSSLRNSSERAAWDVDDFLQAFWVQYPHLAKNQFMIQSASYGGTYIPHIVNTIYSRNIAAKLGVQNKSRVLKMPESVMIGNGWSDPLTNYRWFTQANCHDNPILNSSGCNVAMSTMPACLDAVQYAYEQPSIENNREATLFCDKAVERSYGMGTGRNPYDSRQICDMHGIGDCFLEFGWLDRVMNEGRLRDVIGVPDFFNFSYVAKESVAVPFIQNGDMMQPAYRLLAPAINAGLRVLIYNGNTDGVCSWRSNLAWMSLLDTSHQQAFRSAPLVIWPGIGWVRKVGEGAGVYTFVSVNDAGHFVEWNRPQAYRDLLVGWLRNESFGAGNSLEQH